MKLIVKTEYHNPPHGIHLSPGTLEVDDKVAEFVLRDAPDNFEVEKPEEPEAEPEVKAKAEPEAAVIDKPPADRAMRRGKAR